MRMGELRSVVRARAALRDLTIPLPGSTTARDVLSRAIGRLLREIPPMIRARAALVPAQDLEAFDRLLTAALRDRLGPFASVLRQPNVGSLVRTLRRPATEGDRELLRELVGLVCFELAVMGELPFEVRLRAFPPRIVSLAADASLDLAGDALAVSLTSGQLRLTRGGVTTTVDLDALRAGRVVGERSGVQVARPFTTIDGGTRLALADNNPVANDEAHPDKSGNAIDLGGASVDAWVASLRGAFALVATYMPDLRAEMELYLAQIVPVGAEAERHLSASFREAIGTVYMTLHPNPMTMVEALIHEFQHNKLNALLETDDVLENGFFPLYASPVRPDPRPLHGVLLAVHAFLPVARLYEAMIVRAHPLTAHASFRARLAQIVAINLEGASVVLEHGKPTAIGAELTGEIRLLDAHFRELGYTSRQ